MGGYVGYKFGHSGPDDRIAMRRTGLLRVKNTITVVFTMYTEAVIEIVNLTADLIELALVPTPALKNSAESMQKMQGKRKMG